MGAEPDNACALMRLEPKCSATVCQTNGLYVLHSWNIDVLLNREVLTCSLLEISNVLFLNVVSIIQEDTYY